MRGQMQRAGRPRECHAIAGVSGQRRERPLRARGALAARPGPADGRRADRRHAPGDGLGRAVWSRSARRFSRRSERLRRGEQSLVLLNRRGFATVVFCRQCGKSIECPHCSVHLTFHKAARLLGATTATTGPVAETLWGVRRDYLEHSGFGTERLEAQFAKHSPRLGLVRLTGIRRAVGARSRGCLPPLPTASSTSWSGTDDCQRTRLSRSHPGWSGLGGRRLGNGGFSSRREDLSIADAGCRTRGPGEAAGEAIVQTLYPDHYSVRAAARQDYQSFFDREMEFRRAMHYPPDTALINVVVKGRTLEAAMADATDLVSRVRAASAGRVLGPAPPRWPRSETNIARSSSSRGAAACDAEAVGRPSRRAPTEERTSLTLIRPR